jgi:Protein of unknown function (DUF2723)
VRDTPSDQAGNSTVVIVPSRARDVLFAAAVAAASLALYVATLQPDFGGPEDTPKFQFIGYVLGIPHPPGYPLYVLLSHAFVALPIGTIAYRANLFSAVMAALACSLVYVIGRQLGARRWSSLCAALGLATGASFWRSAVFAEVYSLGAVMAALAIALLLAWAAQMSTGRLLATIGAFAFGLGNHLTIVGMAPAVAVYVVARGRRLLTIRTVAASVLVLFIGISQYYLIVVRTRQEAPYLETRATHVRDLVGVVTAERFAGQRFAFGPTVLITDHLPAVTSLIGRELGIVGSVMFLLGVAAGLRRWDADPRLVLGAAAGMFGMVLNITGDLRGFITPLMTLLWPFTALGVDEAARLARSIGRGGRIASGVLLAAAAILPVNNLVANYHEADQSGHGEEARFLRAAFGELPDRAAFVPEDYWSDMALHYYRFTGEAGRGRIQRIGFDAMKVREAFREQHRVFAFAGAATFLAAEGLRSMRWPVDGAPLDEWLARLPRGSVVAGAMAYAPAPPDLLPIGHPDARPPGRPRSFEAFAAVVGRRGAAWSKADEATSLAVDAASLGVALPTFAGPLLASAGANEARIDLSGRTIARTNTGLALAVFAPDGSLLRTLEFALEKPQRVPYAGALYELAGELPCVELTTERWTDIDAVLAKGSWVTTIPDVGSVVVEAVFPESRDVRARSSLLLGDGSMRTTIAHDLDGDILSTELTRSGERRPVFRLALDRPLSPARARLRPGGSRSSLKLCSHEPVRPLFDADGTNGVLQPDFESEPYFGAGWGDANRSPTGPSRDGEDGATVFLPLEQGRGYRALLALAAAEPVTLDVTLNGVHVGECDPHGRPCDVALPAVIVRNGMNTLMFSRRDAARAPHRPLFRFLGGRIAAVP